MQLISIILSNHKTKENGKGMPLGNLTSQFFAIAHLFCHELCEKFLKAAATSILSSTSNSSLANLINAVKSSFQTRDLELSLHIFVRKRIAINVMIVASLLFSLKLIISHRDLMREGDSVSMYFSFEFAVRTKLCKQNATACLEVSS